MEPPSRPSQIPDRYRLGAELGRGGMGRVVEAFDVQLGRSVALKEALPRGGNGTFRRFAREVQITARLEHASIVPLYDSGTTPDGRPFYVMRRVTGRPLDEMIARARGLAERLTLLPSMLAAMDAIAHAHKRGVIHRDLKPGNILVGELGETVVIDWGLAKVIGEEDDDSIESLEPRPSDSLQTQAGSVFGTPGFMAPEQARGEELGPRGDVYALGACLYQLLAGTPPFGGSTSATEVIDRTRKNQIRPLSESAPGAPRELVAIVEKALSFDPQHRYANATQLGEDLRRFTQGQLVAAHRYTRRQRVARFAKRHRLSLVIAAASMVAIAVLSWINVHRIMVERQMAVDEQIRTQEAADELLIQNAYNYLDSDPTHALAVLKKLDPSSHKLGEARSIAEAAVARGVAWAIDANDDDVMPPDFSPDGRYLSMTTFNGLLTIYDLDTRAQVRTKSVGRGGRGIWVDNGRKLLVWGGPTQPYLLDVATNQNTPIAIDKIHLAYASPSGDHVLYEADRGVGILDVATGTAKSLWAGKGNLLMSSDANWFAIDDDATVALYDKTGSLISTLPLADAHAAWLVPGPANKLGLSAAKAVYEYDIASATWTQRPLELGKNTYVLSVVYRGDRLCVYTTDALLLEWVTDHWIERAHTADITSVPVALGDEIVAVGSSNHLYWATDTNRGTINLPNFVPSRVGARRGVSRIALTGRGVVLVYDMTSIAPKHIPVKAHGGMFTFIDDDTLLTWTNGDPWEMYNVKTDEHTTVPVKWIGAAWKLDARASEKRALLVFAEMRSHLLEVRVDAKPVRHLASGPGLPERADATMVGRLIPGDVTMFADNDNRLYATFADAHPNEITQLDGTVRSITQLGRLKFAAISDNGEVVRGSLEDNKIERNRVPARDDLLVENDLHGHLLIAAGKELLQWDSDIEVVKKFDRPIVGLTPIDGGVLVALADHSLVAFDLATKQVTDIAPRNTSTFEVTDDGRLFAGLVEGGALRIASLPDGVAWQLPAGPYTMAGLSVSPHSHRVVVGVGDLAMWQLPVSDDDLLAWIDRQTNAQEQGRGVVWPWQK